LNQLKDIDRSLSNINNSLARPFLEIEVDTAIQNMKLKSAPGIVQIDYNVRGVVTAN